MWSAISRIFSKKSCNEKDIVSLADDYKMDRNEERRKIGVEVEPQDTYDTRQAKQRASIKWLLSKAYNNKVPENLREPFYRDHEDQEHLKPLIVGSLANADLYCLGLANIYSDPNYHNLNHSSIIQALARKGVFVSDFPDAQLTETVLIQTTPLKLSAHMAVIEALMVLYAKEVVTPDRVAAAIQRFSHSGADVVLPSDHEDGLLLWVRSASQALHQRIVQELEHSEVSKEGRPIDSSTLRACKRQVANTVVKVAGWDDTGTEGQVPCAGCGYVLNSCLAGPQRKEAGVSTKIHGESEKQHVPDFPLIRDFKDLCDGVSLAALVSFYCPEEVPWTEVVVNYLPTISNSVQNLLLVYNFCNRCLPSSVFHMMPEDVTYMQASMKHNLIVFLADLFNVLEIHPVKCVRFPGTDRSFLKEVYPRNSQGVAHKRSFPQSISAIPDLRSNLGAHSSSFTVSKSSPAIQTSYPIKKSHSLQQADIQNKLMSFDQVDRSTHEERHSCEEQFVVHRGRAVPTLSSVVQSEEPLVPARLRPAKEKQNQDTKAEERGEPVAAGRPSNWEDSRRSSYAGRRSRRNSVSDDSQLTLENFGGSQENLQFLGRNPDKEPAVHVGRKQSTEASTPAVAVRSSAQDARSSGVEFILSDTDYVKEKRDEEKPAGVSLRQVTQPKEVTEPVDTNTPTSFAELSRQNSKGIQIAYMQHEKENDSNQTNFVKKPTIDTNGGTVEKKTTFAALPNNTTTWQQQSTSNQLHQLEMQSNAEDQSPNNHIMASQLHNVRMKLEEKRRRIESEKRRMEVVMHKQRQKVGKAAFLQAVSKGKNSFLKTPDSDSGTEQNGDTVDKVAKPQRPFSLQEISEDVSSVEHKWLDNSTPYIEDRKTPDIENMDMEQYQQSIAQMNSSLHEIQADIQRLESQQNRIKDLTDQPHNMHSIGNQQVPMQSVGNQQMPMHSVGNQQMPMHSVGNQQMPMHSVGNQQMQVHNVGNQQMQVHNVGNQQMQMHSVGNMQMHSLPNHHPVTGQFYLHDQVGSGGRRTWAQQPQPQHDIPPTLYQEPRSIWTDSHRQQKVPQNMSYGSHQPNSSFALHDGKSGFVGNVGDSRYHNGDHSYLHHGGVGNYSNNSPFQLHQTEPGMFASPPPQVSSPQHRINQLMSEPRQASNEAPTVEKSRGTGIMHAPIPTPPVDDMEPQSISFIGAPNASSEDGLVQNIKGLHITSGSRTYRIPSPTRPTITRNPFQKQDIEESSVFKHVEEGNDVEQYRDPAAEKGFYISFDGDSQPKRPKPPLRVKRSSPKKERAMSQYETAFNEKEEIRSPALVHESHPTKDRENFDRNKESDRLGTAEAAASGVGLIIGTELYNPDPVALDEMERKKERIMLLSLQRRQQQEELKQYKEQEAQRRRELEKLKQEERERKKEEERLRRAAILEQYKLKKAIEEAEREGKLLPDKCDTQSTKPVPKMRNKSSTTRPRPKTIHVDSSAVDLQEGVLSPSRSKKGSTSNLTETVYSPNMRRDYYRGSQDSLAERYEERRGGPASLFRDSPDDGRGASPCRSVNQLGRRGSYKTSRDMSEPGQVRGRQKYPSYQGNFRGRKSNSLMNLSGSSTDQDSIVYRYTDTDSGLGRATPPRRAPSPGMSGMRHLPSPSGPGSLPPGLMSKRRMFDDGSSDISSTPSSMMEYTGPRLYKQPATKSNRGIMLNAVEYCVFPGVVNKEAKRRVLEEIARSESKHFLILFRDAGCQFRALYSYCPDREEVSKLYGTGPKQVNDRMFDKFFKYNSGGKCFSQVHTKHLTVTIDAFTIHNSLWQGKKVALPNKKDMALVI